MELQRYTPGAVAEVKRHRGALTVGAAAVGALTLGAVTIRNLLSHRSGTRDAKPGSSAPIEPAAPQRVFMSVQVIEERITWLRG